MTQHSSRRLVAGTAVTVLVAGMLMASPGTANAFGDGSLAGSLLRGSAHGGNANLANGTGSIVRIGDIAKQSLGCNPALGATSFKEDDEVNAQLNYLGSITLPLPNNGTALRAKQLRNTGYPTATDIEANVFERATSSTVNVLDGVVTATTIQETAHTRLDANGYHNEAEMIAQDLYVDPDGTGPQQPIAFPNPAPNTTVDLGPIGQLVLNEQIPNAAGITANAVHLHVGDYQGYHGDIYVAHVQTTVSKVPARISGYAFSSRGTVAPLLANGKQALVNLPCSGTGEKDKVSAAARVILPNSGGPVLIDESALNNIVNGKTSATSPYSRSTSQLESLVLLKDVNGAPRITADAVQVQAYTFAGFDRPTYDATGAKVSISGIRSTGSMNLVNLVVDGEPIAVGPAPNQGVSVAGLGDLVLNEQRCKDSTQSDATSSCSSIRGDGTNTHYNQITVTGLHLTVTVSPNSAGLPVGAQILIAQAHSDLAF